MPNRAAVIRSVGRYLPEHRLTNQDLEKMVDTTDDWILTRTGIRERRILDPGLATSHMAASAGKECLERAGVDAGEIDMIIVSTISADMTIPATACLVQRELGATRAWGYDLGAACSGFVYSLTTAAAMIESGRYEKILVISADTMSTIVNYEDRNTCVLFGDGAAAALLEPSPEEGYGILDCINHMDGAGSEWLKRQAGGSRVPLTEDVLRRKEHLVTQDGKRIFKVAVKEMAAVSLELLRRNGLTIEDLDVFIPHQANSRIIVACAQHMDLDPAKVVTNIETVGNTVNATIPLALYQAVVEEGRLKRGDNLILTAFGAGLTWGGVYIKWYD